MARPGSGRALAAEVWEGVRAARGVAGMQEQVHACAAPCPLMPEVVMPVPTNFCLVCSAFETSTWPYTGCQMDSPSTPPSETLASVHSGPASPMLLTAFCRVVSMTGGCHVLK